MGKTYKGKKSRSVSFSVAIQFTICTTFAALVLAFQGLLFVTIKKHLFQRLGMLSATFVFCGMIFTNTSMKYDLNFILFNMVKNSKCIASMLVNYLLPIEGANSGLTRKNIYQGMVITAGLFIFNISVISFVNF